MDKRENAKKRSRLVLLTVTVTVLAILLAACGCKKPQDPPDGGENGDPVYSLSATSLQLSEGENGLLTVSPAPSAETTVIWATSDSAVATVDGGTVTAKSVGTATVTCSIGDNAPLSCTVTVTEAQYRLSYTVLSLNLLTGSSTAKIDVYDRDGNAAGGGDFVSSDTGVATVDSNGNVTAVANGTAIITVSVDGHRLVCEVRVRDGYDYTLGATAKYLAKGAAYTLTLSGGNPDSPAIRTFQSSNSAIASVDPVSGKITAVGIGTAEITCKVDGIALDCTVYVSEYSIPDVQVQNGGTAQIEITTVPANRDTSDATFTPSDSAVVRVDADGTVHGLKIDNTTVTVNVGGKDFTVAVSVVGSFSLTDDDIELVLGRESIGEQTLAFNGGVSAADLTFESDDESVAIVAADGKITARALGTCKVTGTSKENPNDKVVATVKVVMPATDTSLTVVSNHSSIALSRPDTDHATLDYRYYHGSATLKKIGGNLIGDYTATATPKANSDYQSGIWITDGETADNSVSMNGTVFADRSIRTVAGSFEIPVTVNANVTKLILFTGAWDNSANVTLTLDGKQVGQTSFDSTKRYVKVEFAIDPSGLKTGSTMQAVIKVERVRADGGNLDMVAVAVIGDDAHSDSVKASIAEGENAASNAIDGNTQIDLTGGEKRVDWVFADSSDNFGDHKASVAEGTFVRVEDITYSGIISRGDHHPSKFGWTDGANTQTRSNASSFLHTPNFVVIPVNLPKGKFTVRLYVSAWKPIYNVVCVDGEGKFVGSVQCATSWTNNSAAYEVVFPLDVKEAGTYKFHLLNQVRDGNLGWTAIAIDNENGYKLTNANVALTIGGNATAAAPALTAIGTQDPAPALTNVRIVASDPASGTGAVVETDNQNGLIARNAGTAVVAYDFGKFTLYGYISVAQYALIQNEVSLQPGQTYTPEITATPASAPTEFTLTLGSGEDKVSVSGKVITAVAAGTTTVTVNIGGAQLPLIVTVLDYTLTEATDQIQDGEIVLKLDSTNFNTLIAVLSVKTNDQKYEHVTFVSSDTKVVTVDADGKVTAHGTGEATVTAKVLNTDDSETDVELSVKVKLYADLTVEKTDVAQAGDVNLTTLDGTKKTLDWQYYGADGHGDRMYGNAGLIGDNNAPDSNFWDYGPNMLWQDGRNGAITTYGRSDGVIFSGNGSGYGEFTVKVNENVDYIAIYTGAWHAKNVLTVGMFGIQVATDEFGNNGSSDSQWKNVRYDVRMGDYVKGDTVLTIRLTVDAEADNGWRDNVSLIAVAVIGKADRESGSTNTTVTIGKTQIDAAEKGTTPVVLSDGTSDWWYSHCENDPSTKKAMDDHIIIGTNATSRLDKGNYRYESKTWNYAAVFNWTGGDNHHTHWLDNDVGNAQGTDNVYEGQEHSLGFVLPEGTHTIALYIRSWNAKGYVAVTDKFGNEVGKQTLNEGDANLGEGSCYKVTCTLTVGAADAGYFAVNVVLTDGSNFGLAAATVTLGD